MTRTATPAWRVVRNVLIAVVALLLLTAVTQPLWLAPLMSHELSKRSGREVHLETMWIGVSASLTPVLHLRGVRIANAPWADSDRPFAALGSATAVFSWKSIEQRRPVIALWILADGEVDLERTADGMRNWRLTNPEYRGPGRWKVLAVQGERATVRFVHGGMDLDLRAVASPAAEGTDAIVARTHPTRIEVQGRWHSLPFSIGADTGPVLTLLETGETFPVRGHLEAGGARLELDGSAGDIVRRPVVDARVSLVAPSIAPFAAFLDPRHRETKAVRVEGALKTGDGRYALSGATARVGATDLAGDFSWTRSEERNVVRAKLESDSTDVADLRWLAGLVPRRARASIADAAERATSGVTTAASDATSRVAASAPGLSHEARETDAELSFVARRLHAAELPALQSGRVEAALADGTLTVSRFDIGLAQGHVEGRATVGVHDAPMRAEVDVNVRGVRVEPFLRDVAGKSRITGALQGHALLRARGDSAGALRDSVAGRITASLTGGTISSRLDAEIGLQVGKIMRSFVGGVEAIPIRCAIAVVDVERGAGRLRTLVVDTERTRTVATGTIDIAGESLDVVLTPEAKQAGLLDLERSIRVHGPLRHPARELIARAEPRSASQPAACAPERS